MFLPTFIVTILLQLGRNQALTNNSSTSPCVENSDQIPKSDIDNLLYKWGFNGSSHEEEMRDGIQEVAGKYATSVASSVADEFERKHDFDMFDCGVFEYRLSLEHLQHHVDDYCFKTSHDLFKNKKATVADLAIMQANVDRLAPPEKRSEAMVASHRFWYFFQYAHDEVAEDIVSKLADLKLSPDSHTFFREQKLNDLIAVASSVFAASYSFLKGHYCHVNRRTNNRSPAISVYFKSREKNESVSLGSLLIKFNQWSILETDITLVNIIRTCEHLVLLKGGELSTVNMNNPTKLHYRDQNGTKCATHADKAYPTRDEQHKHICRKPHPRATVCLEISKQYS